MAGDLCGLFARDQDLAQGGGHGFLRRSMRIQGQPLLGQVIWYLPSSLRGEIRRTLGEKAQHLHLFVAFDYCHSQDRQALRTLLLGPAP